MEIHIKENNSSNYSGRRIARNTFLLYIRTFVVLIINLYSSRVLLDALGIEDFGIFNLVGSVIVLFTFLNNAMTNSTQRFLNYYLGKKNITYVHKVFCTTVLCHFIIILIIVFFAETVGLWFVNNELNIPQDRMIAMNFVYQFAIVITCVNIFKVPYHSIIIAYEKMSVYAYLSIFENLLKLMVIYLLYVMNYDKLILYSGLLVVISILIFVLYYSYCKRFKTCKFYVVYDSLLFKKLLSFSGWNLFGSASMMTSHQGVNFLLNIFYNVSINAAVGISNQVKGGILAFVTSFQTAFNPQIVKLYANSEMSKLMSLIVKASTYSFYLMFVISYPIIICCSSILHLWLGGNVPCYSIQFTQITVILSIFDTISSPLMIAIGATGKVKVYQLVLSLIFLSHIFLSWIALQLGYDAVIVFYLGLIINITAYIFRIVYVYSKLHWTYTYYLKSVIFPCLKVIFISLFIFYALINVLPNVDIWYAKFLISFISGVLSVIFFGINKEDRSKIYKILKKRYD